MLMKQLTGGTVGGGIDLYNPDFIESSASGMTSTTAKHFTTTKKPKYVMCLTYYSGAFLRIIDVENQKAHWWGYAGSTSYDADLTYSSVITNVSDTGFDLYGVSGAATKDWIFAYY